MQVADEAAVKQFAQLHKIDGMRDSMRPSNFKSEEVLGQVYKFAARESFSIAPLAHIKRPIISMVLAWAELHSADFQPVAASGSRAVCSLHAD